MKDAIKRKMGVQSYQRFRILNCSTHTTTKISILSSAVSAAKEAAKVVRKILVEAE